MLAALHIENIAVIKKLDIELTEGFTVLTGETGAGKSIIIDSINLILGAKPEKELIRSGESFAMVSGLFSDINEKSLKNFERIGIIADEEGNVLIQRTINLDGKSQIRINGRSVTLSHLREVASDLISIHGQSDTYAITEAKNQLDIIDLYSHCEDVIAEYKSKYENLVKIRSDIEQLELKQLSKFTM